MGERIVLSAGRIITANRLLDGAVVYLAAGDQWTAAINEAHPIQEPVVSEALSTIAAAGPAAPVVDARAIAMSDWRPAEPHGLRERIRRRGPTVRPDLARG